MRYKPLVYLYFFTWFNWKRNHWTSEFRGGIIAWKIFDVFRSAWILWGILCWSLRRLFFIDLYSNYRMKWHELSELVRDRITIQHLLTSFWLFEICLRLSFCYKNREFLRTLFDLRSNQTRQFTNCCAGSQSHPLAALQRSGSPAKRVNMVWTSKCAGAMILYDITY